MKLKQLVRKLKLSEALSPEFKRFCHMAAMGRAHRTTPHMVFLISAEEVDEFSDLLRQFKRKDVKMRRFARGPREHRRGHFRPTSSHVADAHSFAYYFA